MSRQDVLEGLERGVVALRAIDRAEDAEHLLEILRDYANERKDRDRERAQPKRELTEREVARQHLKFMRYAFEALRDAGKEDAADLMEHAIHARELRLEGADGPDAREVMKSAPKRGAEIELLLFAAKFLRESGKTERAQVVQELGERFQETWKRNREREQARDRDRRQDRERSAAGERESRIAIEQLAEQAQEQQQAIRHLAEQLERLALSNERLQQELKRAIRRD